LHGAYYIAVWALPGLQSKIVFLFANLAERKKYWPKKDALKWL